MPLHNTPLATLLSQIAERTPSPGGGAVASCIGAFAASLAHMALAYSINSKTSDGDRSILAGALDELKHESTSLLELADMDAEAYSRLNALQKLDKNDPKRQTHWDEAVREAINVPVEMMRVAMDILERLHDLGGKCNRYLLSDFAIAAILGEACVRSAAWNVFVNLASLTDQNEINEIRQSADSQVQQALAVAHEIEKVCAAGGN